jgi:hypothetical protein
MQRHSPEAERYEVIPRTATVEFVLVAVLVKIEQSAKSV